MDAPPSTGPARFGSGEFLVFSVVQAVADLAAKPLDALRVLDLGCQDGGYAVEFGLHGAQVLGIEARPANIERARAAVDAFGLDRVDIQPGDVRDLDQARLGRFDVVLCLGILYHLEARDAVRLIETCHALCDRMLVIRSAIGLSANADVEIDGRRYRGRAYREDTSQPGASIDRPASVLPTRASLLNLLADVGFCTVVELRAPPVPGFDDVRDTVTYVALRGERRESRSAPELNAVLPGLRRPERRGPSWIWATAHPQQGAYWRMRERLFHSFEKTIWSRRTVEEWKRRTRRG